MLAAALQGEAIFVVLHLFDTFVIAANIPQSYQAHCTALRVEVAHCRAVVLHCTVMWQVGFPTAGTRKVRWLRCEARHMCCLAQAGPGVAPRSRAHPVHPGPFWPHASLVGVAMCRLPFVPCRDHRCGRCIDPCRVCRRQVPSAHCPMPGLMSSSFSHPTELQNSNRVCLYGTNET